MIKAEDFHPFAVQLAVFTTDPLAFSTPKSLAVILGKFSHIYDGEVKTFPIPDNAPPEIPRVILQSKDQSQRLDISPARLSFYSVKTEEKAANPPYIISESTEILEQYLPDIGMRVNRLGLIFARMHQLNSPAKLITERFCKPELQNTIFGNTASFDFRNHQIIKIHDLDVNLVTSIKSGLIQINGVQKQGVLIEQDINTTTEEMAQRSFEIEEIRSYFDSAVKEAEANLKIYFPEEV
jgi:hypothetical protein